MKRLRIVFMGTPEFAVASLQAIMATEHQVVGVITAPDKPAGRGRKLHESAVKKYAMAQGLNVLQPSNLKDPEFLESLKELRADLQVVVAFRMLPKQVWEMPPLGTFNLHASLLPEYRGAAPINWAIINGENLTGVTTFYINEDIDTGAIIKQAAVEISRSDTAGDLHDKLMRIGSQTVVETIEKIEKGNISPQKQQSGQFKAAPKLNKENCRIQWENSAESIYNQVRGLSPYPGAWTYLENNGSHIELKIYRAEALKEDHELEPGMLSVSKKNIRVAVKDGFIDIMDLKMSGKKRMDAKSLLNGYEFHAGCKLF
jgi:methionyl-tRNA formyltransferase